MPKPQQGHDSGYFSSTRELKKSHYQNRPNQPIGAYRSDTDFTSFLQLADIRVSIAWSNEGARDREPALSRKKSALEAAPSFRFDDVAAIPVGRSCSHEASLLPGPSAKVPRTNSIEECVNDDADLSQIS